MSKIHKIELLCAIAMPVLYLDNLIEEYIYNGQITEYISELSAPLMRNA
ncbi:hypothetical protein yberc0001_26950 [Yersinia bercovieri ATCC 43970]|uniref:Uncharacterized protein n=1 Tax=Yersinia bercovieri ATCC 43970 TaxID=349968 RepID=A0ABM9XZI5_YERBE|nr:hypothetical protein yberc0001_26950 [Yersinia bercovieri ATCC 43970]